MIYKFGNPATTLKAYLYKKWGWPSDGLANPHNSVGKQQSMRDETEKQKFLESKYIPGNGKHHKLGRSQ